MNDWTYINVSPEQTRQIDQIIENAKKQRGIHRSRADIVADALADYFQRPDIKKQLTT